MRVTVIEIIGKNKLSREIFILNDNVNRMLESLIQY